jgi:3-phosphoshikimate 1-carboxyvinyltransferase
VYVTYMRTGSAEKRYLQTILQKMTACLPHRYTLQKSMAPLTSSKADPLSGYIVIPGDKSISHRALMFGGLAEGETMITGLLEGEDVIATAMAMRAMGAKIEKGGDGMWRCFGTGIGFLKSPEETLDMGNSGTSARLLSGIIAGHNITATMTGDASLCKRPMKRVIDPLTEMGARFESSEGGRLPMTITGTNTAGGFTYRLPVASAQVKSAVLLAGLGALEPVQVIEEIPTRDHTENMLKAFGFPIDVTKMDDGATKIKVQGGFQLQGCRVDVPADPSSAAFAVVAALLVDGSNITCARVCLNERRAGIYKTLQEMGADITFMHERMEGGEHIADLLVRGGTTLKGVDVPAGRIPSMIDEIPVLAIAAACADGTTKLTGIGELRVKESDRLAVMAEGLKACGVELEEGEDTLTIHGNGKPPKGGATVKTHLDHWIAMSFLVLGTVSTEAVQVDDGAPIRTSFPTFVDLMNDMGCVIG